MGISLDSELGVVPEYEEREAAVYCLITWAQWQKLHWYERAASVAQYRMHSLIEAHVQDAANREVNKGRK